MQRDWKKCLQHRGRENITSVCSGKENNLNLVEVKPVQSQRSDGFHVFVSYERDCILTHRPQQTPNVFVSANNLGDLVSQPMKTFLQAFKVGLSF